MNAGAVSGRVGLATLAGACALACGAGLVMLAGPADSGAPGTELRPDLVVKRPYELYLAKRGDQIRLRVSNTVANRGTGPLEIQGNGSSCDDGEGRRTIQRIFEDDPSHAASLGYFIRGQDDAHADFEAGCSRYHPSHDHWHFDNFARYTLLRESTGARVAGSRKVSFCVIDTGRPYGGLPGSPSSSYYPQDPVNPDDPTCSETSIDGLSIGWEDTYGANLPGQGIKVTGLRRGAYCLVLEADPPITPGDGGILAESNERNNAHRIRLRMRPHQGVVRRLDSDCRAR